MSADSAAPGDIVAVAGIEDITIGESLVDLEDPASPRRSITVDDPAISMTIGINTSPMAGRVKGAKVTARQVKDRLDRELIGNVSTRRFCPPSVPTLGRSRAVASSPWRSWWSRCAVKASSSPSASRR